VTGELVAMMFGVIIGFAVGYSAYWSQQ